MKKQHVMGLALLGGTFFGLAWYSSGFAGPLRIRCTQAVAAQQAEPQAAQKGEPKTGVKPKAGAKTDPKAGAKKTEPKDDPHAAARKVVLANVEKYMEAFNGRDVKAILSLFSEDCDVTEADGTQILGHEELEAELKAAFEADPKAQISIAVESLTFITPDVAVEVGKVTFFPDGKILTAESEYQVTHVKKGKSWLMSHARTFHRKVLSPYDRLRDLEWLVGDWVDESAESLIESHYRWDENKIFLLQEFKIKVKGQKVLEGNQRIGWDPLTKQIKAWAFDSEGGYAESLWSAVDDGWIVKAKGVRADGRVVTATNHISQIDKDLMRFESVDRIVGEEEMPGFTAFIVRKPPPAKN